METYGIYDLDSELTATSEVAVNSEPITLNQAKTWLRIPLEELDYDSEIQRLISSAREYGESLTRRSFVTRSYLWKIHYRFPGGYLRLPKYPVQSVESIEYYSDEVIETVDPADYLVDSGFISYIESWPETDDRLGAISIEFIAGHSATNPLPKPLVDGMLEYLTYRFAKRLNEDDIPKALRRIFLQYRM